MSICSISVSIDKFFFCRMKTKISSRQLKKKKVHVDDTKHYLIKCELRLNRSQPCSDLNLYIAANMRQRLPSGEKSRKRRICKNKT